MALTPLYVKTVVQAAKSAAWRARWSAITRLKDLAGEKAFETADDLPFGPPFNGASFDVVEGW